MKTFSQTGLLVSSALLVVVLAGCAAPVQTAESHAHGNKESMDMQAMCEMHKKMMSGKSTAEQQGMMQQNMKSASPEMGQRMQAMHEKCK
jgi:predicted carbohydrate-binding protein with CBM5 and CBM33 domain